MFLTIIYINILIKQKSCTEYSDYLSVAEYKIIYIELLNKHLEVR